MTAAQEMGEVKMAAVVRAEEVMVKVVVEVEAKVEGARVVVG